ncbi:hypothetical protein ABN448_21970 [Delftia acidovorans]|uniref:hypothetical protein n=1 Tax=Delftia acidovorans TaxID=80866 RepID=UPI0032DEA19F
MTEKQCCLTDAIGMVSLFCIFGGIILGCYPGWDVIGVFLENNIDIHINWNFEQNAPAWVQAVFSLIAIVATGYGLRWQFKKTIEMQFIKEQQGNLKSSDTCLEMCNALRSIIRDKEKIFYEYQSHRREYELKGVSVENNLMWEKFLSLERVVDLQEVLRILVSKDMPLELLRSMFGLQKFLARYKEFLMYSPKERGSLMRMGNTFAITDAKLLHSELKKELNKLTKEIVEFKESLS